MLNEGTIYNYNEISFSLNKTLTLKKGDSSKIYFITVGTNINNIERLPNKGGIYSRSSGTYSKLIKKYFLLKLIDALLDNITFINITILC